MPVRNLIGTAVSLGRRAVATGLDAASRLRGQDDAPVVPRAPKPGEPGGPKSGTARRTPAAKKPARAKAKKPATRKPAAKRATAAKREPAATANGAGAQRKPGAVPTGQTATSKTRSS